MMGYWDQAEGNLVKEPKVYDQFVYDNEKNEGVIQTFANLAARINEYEVSVNETLNNVNILKNAYSSFDQVLPQLDTLRNMMLTQIGAFKTANEALVKNMTSAVEEAMKKDETLNEELTLLSNLNNDTSEDAQNNAATQSGGAPAAGTTTEAPAPAPAPVTPPASTTEPVTFKHEESNTLATMARNMGMTEDQIKVAIGISRWETGNYKHLAYGYNYGGVTGQGDLGSEGGYAKYSSPEVGMQAYLDNLQKNYFNMGLNTPEEISRKYLGYNDSGSWTKGVYGCMS